MLHACICMRALPKLFLAQAAWACDAMCNWLYTTCRATTYMPAAPRSRHSRVTPHSFLVPPQRPNPICIAILHAANHCYQSIAKLLQAEWTPVTPVSLACNPSPPRTVLVLTQLQLKPPCKTNCPLRPLPVPMPPSSNSHPFPAPHA